MHLTVKFMSGNSPLPNISEHPPLYSHLVFIDELNIKNESLRNALFPVVIIRGHICICAFNVSRSLDEKERV